MPCCFVNQAAPNPTTMGIASTPRRLSQSNRVFPANPVPYDLTSTKINAMVATRMIATTKIVTLRCFIFRHQERTLSLIALPLLQHEFPGQYSKQWQYCIVARLPYSCRQLCGVSVVSSLLTSALLCSGLQGYCQRASIDRTSSMHTSLLAGIHSHRVNTSTPSNATDAHRSNDSKLTHAYVCLCSDRGQVRVWVPLTRKAHRQP